jgi:hypothetical protein
MLKGSLSTGFVFINKKKLADKPPISEPFFAFMDSYNGTINGEPLFIF